jgi:hypothetical protein
VPAGSSRRSDGDALIAIGLRNGPEYARDSRALRCCLLGPGAAGKFESAFAEAKAMIACMPGFQALTLSGCLERPSTYLRGGVFGQELAPVLERPVRADADRAAFVGGCDEAEQQLRAGVIQRREAEFVDEQELVAEQVLDYSPDRVCRRGPGRAFRRARRR